MHKHVDLVAVFAGMIGGLAVAIITHLIAGNDAQVIGGSLAAAAFIASLVTKARARQPRQ
jgi:LytS/YehU family sensor histidine kinase